MKIFYKILLILFFSISFSTTNAFSLDKWTFMVYLDADNNLERAGIDDFLEMAEIENSTDINILVQFDRIDSYDDQYGNWTGCKRFRVTHNMVPTPGNALMDLGEANMGSPDTLKNFINWGVDNYPAQRYAIILWDHGDGWSKKRSGSNSLAGLTKAICWDDSNGHDVLKMQEVKDVINSVDVKMDLIGFDACLMGMIENAYLLKDTGAKVMVGSEELEPGDGWPYELILKDLKSNPDQTAIELGSMIVDNYYESYLDFSQQEKRGQTQSAIDLSKINTLALAVSEFATKMQTSWEDQQEIYNYAKTVINRIEDSVINSKVGVKWRGAQGLAIYFPSNTYSYESDYDDTDFAKNTSWDEFLSKYYNYMSGTWIKAARNQAVEFNAESWFPPGHIDLHSFCSLLEPAKPLYLIQETDYNFIDISSTGSRLVIEEDGYVRIDNTGFSLEFNNNSYDSYNISDNGIIYFSTTSSSAYRNENIPGSSKWNATFIAPYWDDLSGAVIYWQVKGSGINKRLIIQWHDAVHYEGSSKTQNGITFQALLYENGQVIFQYKDVDFGDTLLNGGKSATVGLQGSLKKGTQYSYNSAVLENNSALLCKPFVEGTCNYYLSSNYIHIESETEDVTVQLTAEDTCEWTSESNVNWIDIIEGRSGKGDGRIKFTVKANTELVSRTGTLIIAGQTFTVKQDSSCGFQISPLEKLFDSPAGTGTIEVNVSEDGCAWEAASNVPWVSITSGSTGKNNNMIFYAVQENTDDRRTGSITVADKIFTITQEAPETPIALSLLNATPVKSLSQEKGDFIYYKIQVPSGMVSLQILTNGGTGDCDLYLKKGSLPNADLYDEKSTTYSNTEDIQISNPQSGEWYIGLYAYQTFSGISLTAAYRNQACNYSLSQYSLNFEAEGGTGVFNIITDSSCLWKISTEITWIEILSEETNMGPGEVEFQVSKNYDATSRNYKIPVMGKYFTVNQEGDNVDIVLLSNNIPLTDLSSSIAKTKAFYKLSVPASQKELKFETWDGEGDCDLYIRHGALPTEDENDGSSSNYFNNESIVVDNPQSGDWFIMLYAYSSYSDLSFKGTYTPYDCEYTFSETEVSFDSSGGTKNIGVTTNSGCTWNVLCDEDWIQINNESGTGSGQVEITISANESLDERSGAIIIEGNHIFVTQQGKASEITLNNNIAYDGISANKYEMVFFKIQVPLNQKNLFIDSQGGTGDMDMYVRYGDLPDTENFDYKCYAWGNDEYIYVKEPQAGVWYILFYAYSDSSDVTIKAQYNNLDCNYKLSPMYVDFNVSGSEGSLSVTVEDGCAWTAVKHGTWIEILNRRGSGNGTITYRIPENTSDYMRTNNIRIADQWATIIQEGLVQTSPEVLSNDITQTVSGSTGSFSFYKIQVPAGQESLDFEISGGEGDCDMYIRYDHPPTFRRYDYRPYKDGNNENVQIDFPEEGTWHIMLHGFSEYSDVSLNVRYKAPLCQYLFSETEINAGSALNTKSLTVSTASGCPWNVVSNNDWINITSETSMSGNGTVEIVISENYSWNERIGTISIANQSISIIQQGTVPMESLSNNVFVNNLSGEWGDSQFFKFIVPEGQKNLIIDTRGGVGDADLYMSYAALPTTLLYDYRCYAWGNDEYIYIKNPEPGQWFILIHAYDSYSDMSIIVEYNTFDCNYSVSPITETFGSTGGTGQIAIEVEDSCSWTTVKHGTWLEIASERRGKGNGVVTYNVPPNTSTFMRANNVRFADQWLTVIQEGTEQTTPQELNINSELTISNTNIAKYYQIDVPHNMGDLKIKARGGECQMYVRHGIVPTFRVFDYKPVVRENASVSISNPQFGKWYLMLHGSYSDAILEALSTSTPDPGKVLTPKNIGDIIAILQILSGIYDMHLSPMDLDFIKNQKIGLEDVVYGLQFLSEIEIESKSRYIIPTYVPALRPFSQLEVEK